MFAVHRRAGAALLLACSPCARSSVPPAPASYEPSDPEATAEVGALLSFLGDVSASQGFLFGQHNTNYEGQEWTDKDASQKTSDVYQAVGQFPGMFEFNLAWILEEKKDLKPHLEHATSVGALMQYHWEPSNPVTGGNVKDTSGNAVVEILPGGTANAQWTAWLDGIADFALEAEVPLIIRLFHEMTGGWFWWGSAVTTPAQFREAFQYTVSYLRDTKGVHNVLWAYAPAKPANHPESFSDGSSSLYPGDDVVDIVCFDRYGDEDFHKALLEDCGQVVSFAATHGKVPAICEVGVKSGTQNLQNSTNWWMSDFLTPVKSDEACSRVAWALTWRNSSPDSYWVPLPGQPAFDGFKAFHDDSASLFAGDFDLPFETGSASLV